jgi:hypothetical protein
VFATVATVTRVVGVFVRFRAPRWLGFGTAQPRAYYQETPPAITTEVSLLNIFFDPGIVYFF